MQKFEKEKGTKQYKEIMCAVGGESSQHTGLHRHPKVQCSIKILHRRGGKCQCSNPKKIVLSAACQIEKASTIGKKGCHVGTIFNK
uniref:Uncharacterized protein n=1 Tax=Romanomermis culicivorax TaxID=13658 RepID=A0A915JXL8_ROMCU